MLLSWIVYTNMMFLVYKLTRNDGKIYIGSTTKKRFKVRMAEHKKTERFKDYTFTEEILFSCENRNECLDKEKFFIKEYDSFNDGLNNSIDGKGNHLAPNFTTYGRKHTKETREKIGKALKGRVPWNKGKTGCFPKETLDRWSSIRKGVQGKTKLTKEQVKKLRFEYETTLIYFPDENKIGKNGKPKTYISLFCNFMAPYYNITPQCLRQILEYKSWKNV